MPVHPQRSSRQHTGLWTGNYMPPHPASTPGPLLAGRPGRPRSVVKQQRETHAPGARSRLARPSLTFIVLAQAHPSRGARLSARPLYARQFHGQGQAWGNATAAGLDREGLCPGAATRWEKNRGPWRAFGAGAGGISAIDFDIRPRGDALSRSRAEEGLFIVPPFHPGLCCAGSRPIGYELFPGRFAGSRCRSMCRSGCGWSGHSAARSRRGFDCAFGRERPEYHRASSARNARPGRNCRWRRRAARSPPESCRTFADWYAGRPAVPGCQRRGDLRQGVARRAFR